MIHRLLLHIYTSRVSAVCEKHFKASRSHLKTGFRVYALYRQSRSTARRNQLFMASRRLQELPRVPSGDGDDERRLSPPTPLRRHTEPDPLRAIGGGIGRANVSRETTIIQKLFPYLKDIIHTHTDQVLSKFDALNHKLDGMVVLLDHNNARASSGKASSKGDVDRSLDSFTPHFNFVFSQQRVQDVLAKVTFIYPAKLMESETFLRQAGADVLQTLLFSVQPQDSKSVFASDVGQKFVAFRKRLVSSLLINAQFNRFEIFTEPEQCQGAAISDDVEAQVASRQDEEGSTSIRRSSTATTPRSGNVPHGDNCKEASKSIPTPNWLKKGFVTPAHVGEAGELVENGNRIPKPKMQASTSRRGEDLNDPNDDDIARHGAVRLFRAANSVFHTGREAIKGAFFEELGYLLLPWNLYGVSLDQKGCTADWADVQDDPVLLDDVPHCYTSAGRNAEIARKFLKSQKGLILNVSHEVNIRKGGANSKAMSGPPRTIRRAISLIFVAARMLSAFAGAGDVTRLDEILAFEKHSLQSCYGVALALRDIVDVCTENLNEDIGLAELDSYKASTNLANGISLQTLLPTPTNQERMLTKRCLLMTMSQFKHINISISRDTDPALGNVRCEGVRADGVGAHPENDFDMNDVVLL